MVASRCGQLAKCCGQIKDHAHLDGEHHTAHWAQVHPLSPKRIRNFRSHSTGHSFWKEHQTDTAHARPLMRCVQSLHYLSNGNRCSSAGWAHAMRWSKQ